MKQLTIDTILIKSLNPCEDRFDNYLAYYKSFSGTLEQFLSLEHITYDDKVWVSVKLMSEQQLVAWAAACAESVLDLFEAKFPDDKRLRRAVEAARSWASNHSDANAYAAANAAYAARDAANATYDANAAAARAAAYAANAAYAAAARAAAYATNAAANAVYAAANAANADAKRRLRRLRRQQSLNLTLLLKATSLQP